MENKYIVFLGLYSFLFFQCSSLKTEKQKGSEVLELSQAKSDMSYRNSPDSIHIFKCNGKKYELKAKNISSPYFHRDLRNCLLDRGFHGDEKANKQLATIIESTKYYDLSVFGGYDAEYRGPIIFQAFLNKSQDYTPLNTFDFGDDSKYKEGTVADVYTAYYCKMIESIDGWDPHGYIGKKVNFQETDNNIYIKDGFFNPAYGIEVGTKTYNAMLKAWQEGKIVFKAYGEK